MIVIVSSLGRGGPIVADRRVDVRPPTTEGFNLVMGSHRPPHDRSDLHNASVDEQVAMSGGCGQVHLASGRTCTLDQDHTGSCDFVPHDPS
jgi:hypothetical protein